MLKFTFKTLTIKEENDKYINNNYIRDSWAVNNIKKIQRKNDQKFDESQQFLVSRSENINKDELVATPQGRTREETRRLLLEEHAKAIAEYQAKLA